MYKQINNEMNDPPDMNDPPLLFGFRKNYNIHIVH